MFKIGCRLWNLSIASVLVLTLSNVLLTVRLLHSSECPPPPTPQYKAPPLIKSSKTPLPHPQHQPHLQTPIACMDYNPGTEPHQNSPTNKSEEVVFGRLDLRLGRWDIKREYKYFDFAVVGDKFADLSSKFSVCLATQSSLEKLYSLVQVAQHWNGPISAAVYAAGDDELNLLQLYVAYLRMCFAEVKERVTFHLALPVQRSPKNSRVVQKLDLSGYDCSKPETTLSELVQLRTSETSKWRIKNAYPQNNLRNVARKGCQTGHVFLTDVDIIPSLGLAESLDKFLKDVQCKGLCAYVIPTYELDDRVRFPKNKADLVRLALKGLARPFHHKVFIYNQYATNFSRWQMQIPESADTHISHNVTNFEFLYEPFYVAPDINPQHDERFMGYGYTRNSQVYEMYVAGYQFQVLSPIFTIHWGLQNRKVKPAWRERQNSANRRHFENFKREVFARYHKDPLRMLNQKKPNQAKPAL